MLTRILDLHIEATTNFESNGAISNDDSHLNGVLVSLSIGSIIKTTDTCVQMNEGLGSNSNPNPNPLNFDKPSREFVCLLSSGNQTLADSRAQLSTQLYPNRALIALYVNSDSMTSLGLQPYNGRSAFYLPIAWIDIKDKSDRNGPINTPTRGMIHDSHRRIESSAPVSLPSFRLKCADAIEKENHMRNYSTRFRDGNGCEIIDMESSTNVGHRNERSPSLPQQRLRSGQGVFHIGDWICPECKALVYSFRPDCFRCRTLRPDTGPHIVPRQPKKTALRPEGDVREGDWNCLSCKGHNFADKLACFTCRAPRPQTPIEVSQHLECTERDEHINFETNTISTKGRGVESVVGSGSIDAGIKVGAVVVFPKAPEKFLRSMPGDWTCPSCKEIVFAKRYRCYKCSALRIR